MSSDYESINEKRWRLAKEISELQEQLVNTKAHHIHMKIHSLRQSYAIFESNCSVLARTLSDILNDHKLMIEIFAHPTPESFYPLESSVGVALHNYLAGAKILVDHTRIFVKDMYANTDFEFQCQEKVKQEFAESPVVQFVQRLRNYTLHRSIPVSTTRLNIQRAKPDYDRVYISGSITLNVEKLREWDGWNVKSREYIAILGKEVEIITVAEEYRAVTEKFYRWLKERQQEFHQEEFREHEQISERLESVKQEWKKVWGIGNS